MEFQKYTGLGNDFIITNENISSEKVSKLCDRRFGVGADGLIVAEKRNGKFFMKFFNSDGSRAKMCGNGIRCYTQYLVENGLVEDNGNIEIDTLAGVKNIEYTKIENKFNVRVDMGKPLDLSLNNIIKIEGVEYIYHYVFTGTIHIVIYVDEKDLNKDYVTKVGKIIQSNKEVFPDSINVNFVSVIDKKNIEVMTYERGAGLTLACGTGSVASAYISNVLNLTDEIVNVKLLGGVLKIEKINDELYMTGLSEYIFKGSVKND